MLSLNLEKGFQDTVTRFTQNYLTSREQIQTDLSLFLSQLEYQKLIVTPEKTKNFLIIAQFKKTISLIGILTLQAIASVFRKIYNCLQQPNQIAVNLLLSMS